MRFDVARLRTAVPDLSRRQQISQRAPRYLCPLEHVFHADFRALAITHLWRARKGGDVSAQRALGASRAPLATGVAREGATILVVAGSVRAAPIAGERGETNADDGRDREDEGDRGKSLQRGSDERGWRVTIEKAPCGIERSGSKP